MGDLTSTNIAIIILLKHLISAATPLDHRCVPGPAAHKNHSHFHRLKEKKRKGSKGTPFHVSMLLLCFSPLPPSNYSTTLKLSVKTVFAQSFSF